MAGYWIDFAAAHPSRAGEMILAIEADGATYHSSPTARDRDRLRQEQLERLGWSFHRIWSTDWFTDTESCIAKARAAYDRAAAASDAAHATSAAKPPATLTDPTPPPHSSLTAPAATAPKRNPLRCPVTPGRPITSYSTPELVDVLGWIQSDTLLRTEDQLFQEFMTTMGFQRRGARIRHSFDRALLEHRLTSRL